MGLIVNSPKMPTSMISLAGASFGELFKIIFFPAIITLKWYFIDFYLFISF